MGKNLYQKVIEKHTVTTLPSGNLQLFVGAHFCHEVTSPQAFSMIRERKLKVLFPERTFATADHIVPTDDNSRPFKDPVAEEMMQTIENNTRENNIRFFDIARGEGGIIHVVMPENGLSQPGMTIVCGDSHTATHGAFGAVAFGIGTSQVRDVLATQTISIEPLKVRQIHVEGKLGKGVYAKDVILYILQKLGVKAGVGYVYEFTGSVFDSMNMDERMTVCNMAIEGGARVGYINPDKTTYDFLKGKAYAPKGDQWEKALVYWESMKSDADAHFDDQILFNAADITPIVTWGITPGQSVSISDSIPSLDSCSEAERPLLKEAFDYMDFKSGTPIEGTPIDVAYIGSCTNGRLSDLQIAAEIVKGRKVKAGIKAFVVPGSQKIKKQAEELGLHEIFMEAGFEWRDAGCSLCLAMNPDKLKGRQISASSSNRNFKGRQGSPTGRTLLMSPAMVAIAAVNGKVTDIRKYL